MNTTTGEIVMLTNERPGTHMTPVKYADITAKQRRQQCVSLHDHRSKLGRQLTKARKRLRKKMRRMAGNRR